MRYITGFVGGGYTNDFMNYVNIILLGQMTRRTAVIPPLSPSHIGYDEVNVPFGDVFDLPRAAEELRMNIIEWRDIKNPNRTDHASDPLGCWTAWAAFDDKGIARTSRLPERLGLGGFRTSSNVSDR